MMVKEFNSHASVQHMKDILYILCLSTLVSGREITSTSK